MMKSVGTAMVLLLFTVVPGWSASITVSDQSKTLPGVAKATTTILLNAGLPVRKIGKDRFVVEATGFHCDRHSNGALDYSDPSAGIESEKCRIKAENQKDTTTGQPFGDFHAMVALLDEIQQKNENFNASDCGMGYCGLFIKNITCTIRTDVQNFDDGGRWQCTYADGQ
jgi:hypothetical protein